MLPYIHSHADTISDRTNDLNGKLHYDLKFSIYISKNSKFQTQKYIHEMTKRHINIYISIACGCLEGK